jgi:hypothetical protein
MMEIARWWVEKEDGLTTERIFGLQPTMNGRERKLAILQTTRLIS